MSKSAGIAYIKRHPDIEVIPLAVELPPGFEEDPKQRAGRFFAHEQFLETMLEHKMFQNPINFGHRDALQAAIEMTKNEKLGYYGAPRAALVALQSAVTSPSFGFPQPDGLFRHEPMFPFAPRLCQMLRGMMNATKTILAEKPAPTEEKKDDGPAKDS